LQILPPTILDNIIIPGRLSFTAEGIISILCMKRIICRTHEQQNDKGIKSIERYTLPVGCIGGTNIHVRITFSHVMYVGIEGQMPIEYDSSIRVTCHYVRYSLIVGNQNLFNRMKWRSQTNSWRINVPS
jgi:hypothetical protein